MLPVLAASIRRLTVYHAVVATIESLELPPAPRAVEMVIMETQGLGLVLLAQWGVRFVPCPTVYLAVQNVLPSQEFNTISAGLSVSPFAPVALTKAWTLELKKNLA
jgi:hypothetical protein